MAQLEIKNIIGSTYFIPSPSNIGIYLSGSEAVLIDSGNDKEAGRQILKMFREKDWNLVHIVNTHSNADHIGGNEFLQKRTECRVSSTPAEAAFTEMPYLESSFLFGAFPHKRLRNKFLMAKPSKVTDIILEDGRISGTALQARRLPGHFMDMIGVETPDKVFFTADSVVSADILSKYHIHFLYDIEAHFETLDMLKTVECEIFIPSHAEPSDRETFISLVDTNSAKVKENISVVLESAENSSTSDEILAKVCERYGIELNASQYVLISSTVKSILSYLLDRNELQVDYDKGRMLWSRS